MSTPSQPTSSLQPWIVLAQALRSSAANRDYATLGRLLTENLRPEMADLMVYIRTSQGQLTIVGTHVDLWTRFIPREQSREPSLEEMALVLQAAGREVQ